MVYGTYNRAAVYVTGRKCEDHNNCCIMENSLLNFAITVVGSQWLYFQITTEIQCCCHLIPLYTCYRLNSQQLCITNTSIVSENTMILQRAKLWTKSQALHLEQFCCVMSIVKVLHSFRIHSKFTRVSEIMQ